MTSCVEAEVQNEPEKRAIEVGLQRVVMTSHSDVHVQVNVYLNLPIVACGLILLTELSINGLAMLLS